LLFELLEMRPTNLADAVTGIPQHDSKYGDATNTASALLRRRLPDARHAAE